MKRDAPYSDLHLDLYLTNCKPHLEFKIFKGKKVIRYEDDAVKMSVKHLKKCKTAHLLKNKIHFESDYSLISFLIKGKWPTWTKHTHHLKSNTVNAGVFYNLFGVL